MATLNYRYVSSWFIFDVCSMAPFQSISLLFTKHSGELGFKLLSMLRLWRLRRVSFLFARFVIILFKCMIPVFLSTFILLSGSFAYSLGSRNGNILLSGTSDEFLRQVSSRAYDMRRHLHQSFDSSSYDGTVYDSADIDVLIVLFACGLIFLFSW